MSGTPRAESTAAILSPVAVDGYVCRAAVRRHTIQASLDPAVQPFLHDHQIGGTPVLPGVMGIEAFAEAAISSSPAVSVVP